MPAPRVLILYNPNAGGRGGEALARELEVELRAAGCEAAMRATGPAGQGFRSVEQGRWDVLVLQGGDGTVHDALQALPRAVLDATPLAFYGQGTVNVLSLTTGMPREARAFVECLRAADTLEVPLGRVGDRRWLLFCGAGFQATAMVLVERWSRQRGAHWLLAGTRLRRLRKKSLVVLAAAWAAATTWGRRLRIDPLPDPLAAEAPAGFDARNDGPGFSDVLLLRVREYGGRLLMPVDSRLEEPAFELFGLRSRWPGSHLLLLVLAAAGWMPRAWPWLERHGWLVRTRSRGVRIRAVGRGTIARHADAETLTLPFPLDCWIDSAQTVRLLVPASSRGTGTSACRGDADPDIEPRTTESVG